MKHVHLVLALLAAGLAAGCANPQRSRDLANPNVPAAVLAQQVCSNCHGVDGTSISPNFPNLAAQTPEYIVGQLKEFRSHHRADPAGFEYMWGISRSLSDQQIEGLAAYFATKPARHRQPEADPKLAEAGKAIFTGGIPAKNIPPCASCHGPQGQGNATFPRLANQHVDYVIKQLLVFQRTDERPKGAIMKTIVHDLSPEDVRDVAAYVQTLG